MKTIFFSLAFMFFILGLTACSSWPESARPHYSPDFAQAGTAYKVHPGTFESRLQVEMYDAARKINRQK